MKIMAHFEENELDTPITFAEAVINRYTADKTHNRMTEEYRIRQERELAEVAEHIQVWLKYNSTG